MRKGTGGGRNRGGPAQILLHRQLLWPQRLLNSVQHLLGMQKGVFVPFVLEDLAEAWS